MRAIERIDAANAEDPRGDVVDGKREPRELLFSKRVSDWVGQLADEPSEELLLAARAHTLRRWMIPRDRYPMTNQGYHEWRNALAVFHAKEASAILAECGYSDETIDAVAALIAHRNWPGDPNACTLEDADCLVFLETKLQNYTGVWDETKALRVLRGTLNKMTPEARQYVAKLDLAPVERELVDRAT